MKFFWFVLAFLAALASQPSAARADLTAIAKALPTCALKCIMTAIPQSECAATNATCFCTNVELAEMITLCVGQNCTVKEQLTTKNVTETACGATVRDHTKVVSYTGVIGGVLALLAIILRMIARVRGFAGGKFGWDDATILLSLLLVIPLTCLSVVLADVGLGKDIWTLPFQNITQILYIYYWDESFYLGSLAIIKISILLFYIRIFPKKSFRTAVYIVMGLCAGYGIAFILVSIFQCRPIPMAWKQWDGEYKGKCNNINAQGWTSAIFNIILDATTLALPLPSLAQLALSRRKKIHILMMFSVGFFVTLVSILRTVSLVRFANSHNITWDYVSVGYWSTLEVHFGIVCACMPAIRALFQRVMPTAFGQTEHAKSTGKSGSGGSKLSSIPKNSIHPKGDNSDFVPLVDIESQKSREVH